MGNISSRDVDKAYSGTAKFGRAVTDIKAIIATVIAIPFIIWGITLIAHKIKRTAQVTGTIDSNTNNVDGYLCNPNYSTTCQTLQDQYGNVYYDCKTSTSFTCNFRVKYSLSGGTPDLYTPYFTTNGTQYVVGQKIPLYYDPNNPTDIEMSQDDYRVAGWLMLVISLIILIGAWVWVILTHSYKPLAAYAGAAEGAALAGDVVRQF
jgi:hypothetical protein